MNKNIRIVILVLAILAMGSYLFFVNRSTVPSFSENFLQCSPSELKMKFTGASSYVITVLGVENNICHYTAQVVDQSGTVLPNGPVGIDCRVPQSLVTADTLDHLLGQDKTPGAAAEQTKLQTDYCMKAVS
jgi:hypothetical protein